MTNYITVLEHELQLVANRIWRLRQAVTDAYAKKHELSEGDRRLMKERLEITERLYNVMQRQLMRFIDGEEMVGTERSKDEVAGDRLPPCGDIEIANAPDEYALALEDFEMPGDMDVSLLDIMDPLSYWRDFSKKKKKELNESARKSLREMPSRLKKLIGKGK